MGVFVQGKNSAANGTSATLSCSLAPTTGNLLHVTLIHIGDPGAYTAPDASWTQIGSTLNNGTDCYQSDWYRKNIDTTNSFTWSWVNSRVTVWVMYEIEALDQSAPLESSQTNTGNSSTPTTANITTTNANDFLVASFGQGDANPYVGSGTFSSPTNSFANLRTQDAGDLTTSVLVIGGVDSKTVTATGTYNTAVTSNKTKTWTARITAYKDATTTLKQSSDGTGVGAEGYTISIVFQVPDTGIGVEGPTLTGLIQVSDSGIGIESFTGGGILAKWQVDDSGHGAEGYSLVIALTKSDTGVGSEYNYSSSILYSVDSGIGTDTRNISAFVQNFDLGAESESFGVINTAQQSDNSGIGSEIVSTRGFVTQTDAGIEFEGYSLVGQPFAMEIGVSTELTQLMAFNVQKETGLGQETQTAGVNSSDNLAETGKGSEGYSLVVIVPGNIVQITGTTEGPITIQGTIE